MAPSPSPFPIPDKTLIYGHSITPLTQCKHYNTSLDIIAIKHACCNKFYACISCHNELESHDPKVWGKEQRDVKAVLCGGCRYVMEVGEYMGCGSRCTRCGRGFNPQCKGHWGVYFEVLD
ncbi:CHY zinc finger family protein [Lindgomyces ingoldianus]|uniref:CHY zinc finger family protein n=1 Tax=Lindgomyces ingoldianus TaxID=673940 RepID=A0ACB6QQP5_9PLEO|nr:CHY zinc finger family protein [Lindgomyces ingoldianus]KAF2468893.1 CHY zinc finger family protein [Lindgomyces ingoldianus]